MPIWMTRLCVELVWNEFVHCEPPSETIACLIGPERSGVAVKFRWTFEIVPEQPPPFPQPLPLMVTLARTRQKRLIVVGPVAGPTLMKFDPVEFQYPVPELNVSGMLLPLTFA